MPVGRDELLMSSLASSWLMLSVGLFVLLNRRLAVSRAARSGSVLVSWRVPSWCWREYLTSKMSVYLNTLVIWIGFYALAMSLFQGQGSWWWRFVGFAVYSFLMIAPAAVVFGAVAFFIPPTYYLMSQGIGVAAWIPILLRPGTGFLDLGLIDRERVENYRWEGNLAVIKSKRAFLSQGVTEILATPEVREKVEEAFKELRVPKGEPLTQVGKTRPAGGGTRPGGAKRRRKNRR